MADYSQQELAAAQRIIRGLFNGEVSTRDFGEGVAIADIEEDTARFAGDLIFLEEIGADVPAMRLGTERSDLVPVDLQHYLSINNFPAVTTSRSLRRGFFREYWYYWMDDLRDIIGRSEVSLPMKEARSTYDRLAADFLANRIAGARELRGGARASFLSLFQKKKGSRIPVPGCTFSVTTNSAGLRVLWSGGYVISPKFFAAPTSPVSSTLQSGTYVFGVDGGAYGNSPQWDTTGLVTLPGNPSLHLNF